ncbi:ATP synthase delta chain [hydrothermal vent metagenome]|uniref:ATP synthase delta chain n=1 Tax=hydrothermal vent metagenome TaxID=652676 RepID=A0A1W1D3A2_9ZZZZ
MEELIAKRYIKALIDGSDVAEVEKLTTVFSTLADAFKEEQFVKIIENPYVANEEKSKIFLDAVKGVKSDKINNFIKLLVAKRRLSVIPAIAQEMQNNLSNMKKTYQGVVRSNMTIDKKTLKELSTGLGKKFDSKIDLVFQKDDFDGIKVDVDDLGIEINFSKSRINAQMIEHIIKAI